MKGADVVVSGQMGVGRMDFSCTVYIPRNSLYPLYP